MRYFCFILVFLSLSQLVAEVRIREDFDHLKNWNHELLPKVEKQSRYRIQKVDDGSVLSAESNQSASFLHHKRTFNPFNIEKFSWRWRVTKVPEFGDATSKDGDDFAMRIGVVFKYDPKTAGFFKRTKYAAYKAIHGEYPPHSALYYTWANRNHDSAFMESAYTDNVQMLFKQSGSKRLGEWIEEEANIIEDYRKCFGEDPPDIAELCILSDSDNTMESTAAQLDWIELN